MIKGTLDNVFVRFLVTVTKALTGSSLREDQLAFPHSGERVQLYVCGHCAAGTPPSLTAQRKIDRGAER